MVVTAVDALIPGLPYVITHELSTTLGYAACLLVGKGRGVFAYG